VTNPVPSLFVATPCYGGMAHAVYLRGLLALKAACAARGLALHVELGGGDALISRARAALMAQFLASSASHLLFIDADIGFGPEDALRLLAADKPVVGGVYARKPMDGRPATPEVEPLPGSAPRQDGLGSVAFVGAGFLLISRAAAVRLDAAWPRLRARLGDVQGGQTTEAAMVFDPIIDPATGRYLADHQAFCHRWRDLGGEVWADRRAGLIHVGEIAYETRNGTGPA
jgi:hypothetical protein